MLPHQWWWGLGSGITNILMISNCHQSPSPVPRGCAVLDRVEQTQVQSCKASGYVYLSSLFTRYSIINSQWGGTSPSETCAIWGSSWTLSSYLESRRQLWLRGPLQRYAWCTRCTLSLTRRFFRQSVMLWLPHDWIIVMLVYPWKMIWKL